MSSKQNLLSVITFVTIFFILLILIIMGGCSKQVEEMNDEVTTYVTEESEEIIVVPDKLYVAKTEIETESETETVNIPIIIIREYYNGDVLFAENTYNDEDEIEDIVNQLNTEWNTSGYNLVNTNDYYSDNIHNIDLFYYKEENNTEIIYSEEEHVVNNPSSISTEEFMMLGVIYWGDWKFTYYQESVLPGGGLVIPGRWSDYSTGFVRDENNYICLASSDLEKGTIVETPFGIGCVYDCGCASGTLDVYLCW